MVHRLKGSKKPVDVDEKLWLARSALYGRTLAAIDGEKILAVVHAYADYVEAYGEQPPSGQAALLLARGSHLNILTSRVTAFASYGGLIAAMRGGYVPTFRSDQKEPYLLGRILEREGHKVHWMNWEGNHESL